MLYPFVSCADGTEIVYSDILRRGDNAAEYVKIAIERPNDAAERFDSLEYIIPDGEVTKNVGFSVAEVADYKRRLDDLTDVIIESSRRKGDGV